MLVLVLILRMVSILLALMMFSFSINISIESLSLYKQSSLIIDSFYTLCFNNITLLRDMFFIVFSLSFLSWLISLSCCDIRYYFSYKRFLSSSIYDSVYESFLLSCFSLMRN